MTIDFTASFKDGRVFDSTEQRRRPITFDLGNPALIRGLRDGIPGMRVGGKRRIGIPWQLAYGEAGREPIPPRTDLVFEVTLLALDDR